MEGVLALLQGKRKRRVPWKEAKERGRFCPWFRRIERPEVLWGPESSLGSHPETLRGHSCVVSIEANPCHRGLQTQPRFPGPLYSIGVGNQHTCNNHTGSENEDVRGDPYGPRISRLAHIFLTSLIIPRFLSNPVMMETEFPARLMWDLRVISHINSWHLLTAYYLPDIFLSPLHELTHLILSTSLQATGYMILLSPNF